LVGVRFAADTTATKWVDRDLAAVQGEIEKIFPHKIIEISEWDSGRHHFLFLATRDSDPGKFYIFDRPTAAVTQIVRRNPSVEDDEVNRTQSFRIPHGTTTVTGYLTHPAAPIASPSPVLVYLHDGPWQRDLPGSNPDVQALAAMGFTVVQVNYAG
jgi:dipeptidyl aminopeptidase/acylaminoacyl peptidase